MTEEAEQPTRKLPTAEGLAFLSDEELEDVTRRVAKADRQTYLSAQVLLDEHGRRRAERYLRQVADVTAENAGHVERMAKLIEEGAEQNRTMTRLTWFIAALTGANVLAALVAMAAALEWI